MTDERPSTGTIIPDSTTITDHVFRMGGGFENWGRPDFQPFCGACVEQGRKGRTRADHISDADFTTRNRLADAAPLMLDALKQSTNILYAMTTWLEDEDPMCSAGNPDGGGPKECDHCIVASMLVAANEALKASEVALAAAEPPAPDARSAP